jgi:hypothetical protein
MLAPRRAIDCIEDAVCKEGACSRELELVPLKLLVLEVMLSVGVLDGRGSSPPRMDNLFFSWLFADTRLPLSPSWFNGSDRSISESLTRD